MLLAACHARAAGPEQPEQLEPAAGDFQLDYHDELGWDDHSPLTHFLEFKLAFPTAWHPARKPNSNGPPTVSHSRKRVWQRCCA